MSPLRGLAVLALIACPAHPVAAQQLSSDADVSGAQEPGHAGHQPSTQDGAGPNRWSLGFDGVVFGTFNSQGGLRGDTEFVSQNWAMAMGMRPLGRSLFSVTGMVSVEPATTQGSGYSEILQTGEAYHGLQITDHQHPHDLFMQLSAAWRVPVGDRFGVTLAGGPRGEASLGPVAFMHRPSSAENPTAPLSHHILDSTHITTGVALVGVDAGPFTVEGSWFRGREPDENRYDLESGALDSWAARLWFRPSREWLLQVSHGYLHEPEQLEPGDQRRTNGSVSWFRARGSDFTAVTGAIGRNERTFSTVRALLLEATRHVGRTSLYGQFEDVTVETEILLFPQVVHVPHPGELVDPVQTLTGGIVRDLVNARGFSLGIGGDVSVYWLPELLQFTHGTHPVSFHAFVRLRPPSRGGRMWNTTMGRPMDRHERMNGHEGMDHDPP